MFARLKSGIAISAFLLHSIIGISMLSKMYRSKMIDFMETVIAVIISMLPRSIRIIVLFLAPVSISILGFELGLKILILEIVSKLIVVSAGIAIERFILSGKEMEVRRYEFEYFDIVESIKVFLRTTAIIFVSAFFAYLILDQSKNTPAYICFLSNEELLIVISGITSTTAGISVVGSQPLAGYC